MCVYCENNRSYSCFSYIGYSLSLLLVVLRNGIEYRIEMKVLPDPQDLLTPKH